MESLRACAGCERLLGSGGSAAVPPDRGRSGSKPSPKDLQKTQRARRFLVAGEQHRAEVHELAHAIKKRGARKRRDHACTTPGFRWKRTCGITWNRLARMCNDIDAGKVETLLISGRLTPVSTRTDFRFASK